MDRELLINSKLPLSGVSGLNLFLKEKSAIGAGRTTKVLLP